MYYIFLSFLWIAWCALHSAMISLTVTGFFKRKMGKHYRYYRLYYNIFSIITFGLLAIYGWQFKTETIIRWNGYWNLLRIVLFFSAVYYFYTGAKNYNLAQFLGLNQIRQKNSGSGISETGKLSIQGVLLKTRHPWYLATILLLWSYFNKLDVSGFIVNVILTIYVFAGLLLEERKLVHEFGEAYRAYQRQVPMLLPFRKRLSK